MTDLLFPPWLRVSSQRVDMVSNTAASQSIFTGATRTLQRSGDRMRFGIRTDNANNRNGAFERATLMALRAQARGQGNRIWYSPQGYSPRGSFPCTEKLDSSTFANGVTNWRAAADASISVQDRVFRMLRKSVTGANGYASQNVSGLTQFSPYVFRGFISSINGGELPGVTISTSLLYDALNDYGHSIPGLYKSWGAATGSAANVYLDNSASSATNAGNYFESSLASVSSCALIDNSPNLLLQSDSYNFTWAASNSSVTANSSTAPDGSATADLIVEDSATSAHYVQQNVSVSASILDYCFTAIVKANSRTWALLLLQENTGPSNVSAYVNLSTGTVGTTSTGTNWINLRTAVSDIGNGWFAVSIIARKTNAAISLSAQIRIATANGTSSYIGNGASSIIAWRSGVAQSSFPVKFSQTTTTTSTGTLQTGASINVKGLPVSTNGLLLPGDYVQIGQQLVQVAASLNSDAAGLGTLQLAYPLRNAPADNDPVIVNTPMGKFVLTENTGGWDESPGIFSSHDFVLEEALDT